MGFRVAVNKPVGAGRVSLRPPCQTEPAALALRSERPSGDFCRSANGI